MPTSSRLRHWATTGSGPVSERTTSPPLHRRSSTASRLALSTAGPSSATEPATCGVHTVLGWFTSASVTGVNGTRFSSMNVSNPAAAVCPVSRLSSSASSSTRPPRATLMRMLRGFIVSSSRAEMRPRVLALSDVVITTTSLHARRSSSVAAVAPAPGSNCRPVGLWMRTRMPNPRLAMSASSRATDPEPTMPRAFPTDMRPGTLSHEPERSELLAAKSLREHARVSSMACSATAGAFRPGVFRHRTPSSLAA
mmetsp:Transcript_16807/g.57080  ORF Transcript_16807/g.57080 Transcript_16807/m.57080 type:complete len:253 (+) Transcript_16807:349-1107(+)